LNSPLCRDGSEADLSASAARNCQTTGFEAAQAPGGDYAFDVHINTGVAHVTNYGSAMFQDVVQFWWTSLVAVVHALVVLLDWCFTLDLLNSPAMSGVGRALRATQAAFTQPWLASALAIASILALYHGLIRRRVAQTLGEALLMLAMMAGGLWVLMNPAGTIGVLGAWANAASLGTLGAVTAGTPVHPERTLAESNQYVFNTAIDGPWCYLEFGDVSWCENAASLDPRLRRAALKIAALAADEGGVPRKILGLELGIGGEGVSRQSAALLRAARTNGALFLALGANESPRNSISERWSLYSVLCGGSEEPCKGPTASQADFRTQSGTIARVTGAAFIAIGLLGMILVLGFIALHLLHAAIVSLVCLLLTPAAVLAPALGESGRGAFQAWATRLLGAVTSKLVFSLLLGVVLESERTLASVRLGWWTQWVLISAMWWIGFLNRHKVLDFAHGERGGGGQHRSIVRRASGVLESRTGMAAARIVKRRLGGPGPSAERRRKLAQAGGERAQQIADAQVAGGLERKHREASALADEGDAAQARISDKRTRLDRMQAEHAAALGMRAGAGSAREAALAELGTLRRPGRYRLGGKDHVRQLSRAERQARDRRMDELRRAAAKRGAEELRHRKSAARLQERMERLRGEIDGDQSRLTAARQAVKDGELAMSATGKPYARAQADEFGRYLDTQAALPRAQRDYAGMAGVVGHTRGDYERLDPRPQREARLQVDRELSRRKELSSAVTDMAAVAGVSAAGRRDQRKGGKELEQRVSSGMRADARRRSGDAGESLRIERRRREDAAAAGAYQRQSRSPVMDDAREVAARRKRQLGRDWR
jgi:hypothetical protein